MQAFFIFRLGYVWVTLRKNPAQKNAPLPGNRSAISVTVTDSLDALQSGQPLIKCPPRILNGLPCFVN